MSATGGGSGKATARVGVGGAGALSDNRQGLVMDEARAVGIVEVVE